MEVIIPYTFPHKSSGSSQQAEACPAQGSFASLCLMHEFKYYSACFPDYLLCTCYWKQAVKNVILQNITFNKIGPSRQNNSTVSPIAGAGSPDRAAREHTEANSHKNS